MVCLDMNWRPVYDDGSMNKHQTPYRMAYTTLRAIKANFSLNLIAYVIIDHNYNEMYGLRPTDNNFSFAKKLWNCNLLFSFQPIGGHNFCCHFESEFISFWQEFWEKISHPLAGGHQNQKFATHFHRSLGSQFHSVV